MKSALEITKLYFDLSNQGNLIAIEKLFQADATYSSVNTGLYFGVENIMPMMQDFFDAHQKLHWTTHQVKALNEHVIELKFSCDAVSNEGKTKTISGVERVVVVDGLIRHIEVN